jgi:hypothetical protein
VYDEVLGIKYKSEDFEGRIFLKLILSKTNQKAPTVKILKCTVVCKLKTEPWVLVRNLTQKLGEIFERLNGFFDLPRFHCDHFT